VRRKLSAARPLLPLPEADHVRRGHVIANKDLPTPGILPRYRAMRKQKLMIIYCLESVTVVTLPGFTTLCFRNEAESRYFKIFKESAAPELSGYFDTNVWTRTILQVCHAEPFALHAVIAIGALHTAISTAQNHSPLHPSIRRKQGEVHHAFALQQYATALHFMRQLPLQEKSEPSFRRTLISCLLTTCFENYVGNSDSALVSAQHGINILVELERAIYPKFSPRHTHLSYFLHTLSADDLDLFSTFVRLETVVILFRHMIVAPDPAATSTPGLTLGSDGSPDSLRFLDMPEVFESLTQAQFCWVLSIKRVFQWQGACMESGFSCVEGAEAEKQQQRQQELIRLGALMYAEARERWLRAFQPLFDRSRKRKGSKEFCGASLLMIQFLSLGILTSTEGRQSELCWDVCLPDHIALVDLAAELLESIASPASKHSRTEKRHAVFIFDDGLLARLNQVATRCRNSEVRRRALSLLQKHPRREGLWDSEMAAKVSAWVIEKEEAAMVNGYVPETARLRIESMRLSLADRRVMFSYSKLMVIGEERIVLPEVQLRWYGDSYFR